MPHAPSAGRLQRGKDARLGPPMNKWPNRIPPYLEKRLSVVTSFRTLGPGDIWAQVRDWLEGQETSVPESLPVHPA